MGGSGLGLFCLSRRCQALGGSCGVKDRYESVGSGAIFWFEIPFITYRKRAMTTNSPQSIQSDGSNGGNSPLSHSYSNQSLASQAWVEGGQLEGTIESAGSQRRGRSSRKSGDIYKARSPHGSPVKQSMFKKLSLIDDTTSAPPSAKLMSFKGILSRLSFKSSSPKPTVSAKGSPRMKSSQRKKNVSGKSNRSNQSDRSSGSFKRKGGGSMKDVVRGLSGKLLSGRLLREEEREFSSVLHPMSSSGVGNSSSSSNGQGLEEEEEEEEKEVFSRNALVVGEDLDLIRMLRELEYHVDFAESGLSAYELLPRKPYDVVVLSLSGLSEKEVLLFLQKHRYMEKSSSTSGLMRSISRKQLILVLIDAYSEDGGELFTNMGASFVFATPLTQQQLQFAFESDQTTTNHDDHPALGFEGQFQSNDTMPFPATVITSGEDEEELRRRSLVEASSSDSLVSGSSNYRDRTSINSKQSTLNSMHVLLIDDSSLILKTLARTFRAGNYQVSQAENGAVALDMMIRNMGTYDAVLIDQQMPVMDGPECVRRFREQEGDVLHTRSPPLRRQLIIGMSANSDEVCKSNAYDAGMDFFLQKPFPLERVEDVVRQHYNMGSYCLDEDFGGVDEFVHPGTVRP